MHITVDSFMFVEAFRRMGRENQFSREALEALFEYIENYEEDTGSSVELDVVGLCCEFTEYTTAVEAASDYGFTTELEAEDYEDVESYEDAKEEEALEWLQDRTEVVIFDSGLIIQNFYTSFFPIAHKPRGLWAEMETGHLFNS